MRNANHIKGLLVALMCSFTSCFSNKYELIGEAKVVGAESLTVRLYQKDSFDSMNPINYELIRSDGHIVIKQKYLTGTDVRHEKIERFHPFLHDSIFYICYPYPEVYDIYSISSGRDELPHESLFSRLKKKDSNLVNMNK